MATLEFNVECMDQIIGFANGDGIFSSIVLTREDAWNTYRELQRVLVGPYSGRNGKYNGN